MRGQWRWWWWELGGNTWEVEGIHGRMCRHGRVRGGGGGGLLEHDGTNGNVMTDLRRG